MTTIETAIGSPPPFGYGWATTNGLVDVVRPTVRRGQADDIAAIQATVITYGLSVDQRRFDVMRDLFSDDASFSIVIASGEPIAPVHGGDTIRTWMEDYMVARTDQLRHLMGNIVVSELGEDTATALAYLTLLSSTPAATIVVTSAWYRFGLSLRDASWRFDTVLAGFDRPF
jgi:hypothetical protein